MKLFKYVSFDAARSILESQSIGFSQAKNFNDPFDTPIALSEEADNSVDAIFKSVAAAGKSHIWHENSGILSLTRSFDNLLMWSHYADAHRGVVIEISAKTAGFTDESTNLIPAQFGRVIYSKNRDAHQYFSSFKDPVVVGSTHHFVSSHYEKWQRMFLTKPLDWAYEEEVRVIKCINGISSNNNINKSGSFNILNANQSNIYCYTLPFNSITSVYIGARVPASYGKKLFKIDSRPSFYKFTLDDQAYRLKDQKINF